MNHQSEEAVALSTKKIEEKKRARKKRPVRTPTHVLREYLTNEGWTPIGNEGRWHHTCLNILPHIPRLDALAFDETASLTLVGFRTAVATQLLVTTLYQQSIASLDIWHMAYYYALALEAADPEHQDNRPEAPRHGE